MFNKVLVLIAFVFTCLVGAALARAETCSDAADRISQAQSAAGYQIVDAKLTPVGEVAVFASGEKVRVYVLTPIQDAVAALKTKGFTGVGSCVAKDAQTYQILRLDTLAPGAKQQDPT